jgi:hypothetical protein
MQSWARYLICAVIGIAGGSIAAVYHIRTGLGAGDVVNGPWHTAKTYGTAAADPLTRARVALGGLLALPAKEAMYFTARTDSKGRPLEGRCRYTVNGGEFEARWWSLTLYNPQGYLVANSANIYSVGSSAVLMNESKPLTWFIEIAPNGPHNTSNFIPSGGSKTFDLTLRVYHPIGALFARPDKVALPTITREGCA